MQVVVEKFSLSYLNLISETKTGVDESHSGRRRYLEMLLSMGYGGGGVQWEEGTRGSCGCSACVGLSELMSAFMGM